MSLTSPIKPFTIRPLPGMNVKQEDLELEGTAVELAQNCRFEDEPGAVIKRDPMSHYNLTSMGSGPVMGTYRFYRTDGNIKSISVHGSAIYVGTDATGAETALAMPAGPSAGTPATLTENKRMRFDVYRNILLMSNGFDNIMCYDADTTNSLWELGSCKCETGTGGGAITRDNISYQITMDDGAGNSDAYVCGAVSNEIDVTAEDVELTNIPIGPAYVTERKIYRRSFETGGVYRLVDTIANNYETEYTDTNDDVSGGGAIDPVTDDMPKGSMMRTYRERLFVAGDPDNPNTIYYSNPYAPWYIQQTTNLDYMEIDKDDGDEIMGIPIALGTMSVVKKNTIRKVHISNATGAWASAGGFQLSSGGPSSWYAEDPIAFTGAVAQWSIIQTQVGILFLGWNHWYQFNGATVTPIIDEFDTDEILSSSYNDVVAHYSKGVLMWAYADNADGNNYHDTVGRYNFFRKALAVDKFTRYDSDTGLSVKTGINCFASYDGDDESGDLYYGDSNDGYIYRAEDTPQWIRWNKKSQLSDSVVSSVFVGGTEDDPWLEVGWDLTIDEMISTNITPTGAETAWSAVTTYHNGDTVLSGGNKYVCDAENLNDVPPSANWTLDATAVSIDNAPGLIDREDTSGTITFSSMQINAGSLINLYWNVRKYDDDDTVTFYIRTGEFLDAGGTAPSATDGGAPAAWVPAAGWTSTPADMSDETADKWFQMKIDMVCNTINGSPRIYFSDGYVIKWSYRVGGSISENEVEFIYDTGWRHFNVPFVDKVWKKLLCWYEGSEGLLTIDWWTENSSGSFDIDLTIQPERWESFLPSIAMGRKFRIRAYKNDIEDLKLKEFSGIYTPEPLLI